MLKSYKDTEQLYPTALSFAVHHALQKETFSADGKETTQEKQNVDALIAKAATLGHCG